MAKPFFLRLPIMALLLATALAASQPARADIAVIVHPQNTLASLDPQGLKKIFLGRMPLFPDSHREIHPIDLPDEDPVFVAFYRQVVELEGTDLKRYRAYYLFSGRGRLPAQAATADDVINKVATEIGAIGYIDARAVTPAIRVILILPDTTAP